MRWRDCRLGDVLTLKRGHDLPGDTRRDGDVPVVSSSGITGYHNEAKANAPGVVTGRYGTLGQVFYLEQDYWPLNTALYVVNFKGTHPRFAAYFLRNVLRDYQSDKAAVPGVDRNVLHEIKVRVPDTRSQDSIASTLCAYDDLIENNRRRMALLEEEARLLYREWFVRLRFPGHERACLTDSPLGRIPNAWRVIRLGDVTTKIGSGATPRGGEAAYLDKGTTLIRSLNVYNDRFEDDGLAFLNDEQAVALSHVSVEPCDILLNITGASVARCCMVPKRHLPARVNQHVMIIRVDPTLVDPYYALSVINSDECKRQLLSYAQGGGATREALTKETVTNFRIVLPEENLLRQFGEVTGEMLGQREVLAHQNALLRTARDLLLPRLMSGEIAVGQEHELWRLQQPAASTE
jgi:type I restriction enzyme S subunit